MFKRSAVAIQEFLPVPIRLLLVGVWSAPLLSRLPLSLVARQFWTHVVSLVTIGATAWLLIRLNGAGERYIAVRFPASNFS